MQCLLIEDDPDDQEIFLLCLEDIRPDVECLVVNNGVDALRKFKDEESFKPDAIFLDVNMPKMNGLDCLRKLKEIPRIEKTCIYIYTTSSEATVVKKAKDFGADDHIVKLSNTLQLKARLATALNMCQQVTAKKKSNER